MCFYIENSYHYYCHLLASNARYWQEILMFLFGVIYTLTWFAFSAAYTEKYKNILAYIGYVIGPVFFCTCSVYCVKQARWIIIRHYIFWQLRPLIVLLSVLALAILELMDWFYNNHSDETYQRHSVLHLMNIFLYTIGVVTMIAQETAKHLSLVLHIFYPLCVAVVSAMNILQTFYGRSFVFSHGSLHYCSIGGVARLLQAQICVISLIGFWNAVRNTERTYFSYLLKPINRESMVHESSAYGEMKSWSLKLQILWMVLSVIVIGFEYSNLDTDNPFVNVVLIVLFIMNTVALIYIEFDSKMIKYLIFHHRFFILFVCMILELFATLLLLTQMKGDRNLIFSTMNMFYWIFAIMFMIIVDGFRNGVYWYRLYVYFIFVLKGTLQIVHTWNDFLDQHLYPEAYSYLKAHRTLAVICDNLIRVGWYFVVGIAFVACVTVCYDRQHIYFVMLSSQLSRDSVDYDLDMSEKHYINENIYQSGKQQRRGGNTVLNSGGMNSHRTIIHSKSYAGVNNKLKGLSQQQQPRSSHKKTKKRKKKMRFQFRTNHKHKHAQKNRRQLYYNMNINEDHSERGGGNGDDSGHNRASMEIHTETESEPDTFTATETPTNTMTHTHGNTHRHPYMTDDSLQTHSYVRGNIDDHSNNPNISVGDAHLGDTDASAVDRGQFRNTTDFKEYMAYMRQSMMNKNQKRRPTYKNLSKSEDTDTISIHSSVTGVGGGFSYDNNKTKLSKNNKSIRGSNHNQFGVWNKQPMLSGNDNHTPLIIHNNAQHSLLSDAGKSESNHKRRSRKGIHEQFMEMDL